MSGGNVTMSGGNVTMSGGDVTESGGNVTESVDDDWDPREINKTIFFQYNKKYFIFMAINKYVTNR